MPWSETIKSVRVRLGMKQNTLSDFLDSDQATISRWERGMSTPTIAMQRTILKKIDRIDPDHSTMGRLRNQVVTSSKAVMLTSPGEFVTCVASPKARHCLGLVDETLPYDWERSPKTSHQKNVYETLAKGMQIFDDKTIYLVESEIAIRLPNNSVVFNRGLMKPTWTGEIAPRLLIQPIKQEDYNGQQGRLVVHRLTQDPEELLVANE